MSNINLNLITTSKKITKTDKLSIDSLTSNREKTDLMKVDNLIRTRKLRRHRILEEYNRLFNNLMDKIQLANSLNKTELIFDIPVNTIEGVTYKYDCNECVDFIQTKIKNLYIYTIRTSYNSIFVSWLYIEINRELFKKSKNKENN